MPEFFNGKNVADFIDPDIEAKLEALEREEEALEAQGFYASDEEEIVSYCVPRVCLKLTFQLDSDEEAFLDAAAQIKSKVAVIKQSSQAKNRLQNRPVIPRKKRHITLQEMMAGMRKNGVDPSVIEKRAKRLMAQKKAEWEAAGGDAQMEDGEGDDGMDVDMDGGDGASTATGTTAGTKRSAFKGLGGKVQRGNRQLAGLKNREQDLKATELRKFAQREPNRLAKASESDRHIPITRPRWMLAGKRKNGKTDYR